jgi:lactoylglutathione lyase
VIPAWDFGSEKRFLFFVVKRPSPLLHLFPLNAASKKDSCDAEPILFSPSRFEPLEFDQRIVLAGHAHVRGITGHAPGGMTLFLRLRKVKHMKQSRRSFLQSSVAAGISKPDSEALEEPGRVHEMRLVVTAEDYDQALHFYRDALGLKQRAAFVSPGGHVAILEAGKATLELADPHHAAFIDEVEVGKRVAGHVRVAFKVDDSAKVTTTLKEAGANVLADVRQTPWNSLNSRLEGPAALQLTLFTEIESKQ